MSVIEGFFDYKIVRYILVGGISTLIHISIAYLYIYFISKYSLYLSNILGFISAFVFSYIAQSKFVYKHSISYFKASKYFIVQLSSLLISILITDYILDTNSYYQVVVVVVVMPMITYTMHNIWTFSEVK